MLHFQLFPWRSLQLSFPQVFRVLAPATGKPLAPAAAPPTPTATGEADMQSAMMDGRARRARAAGLTPSTSDADRQARPGLDWTRCNGSRRST